MTSSRRDLKGGRRGLKDREEVAVWGAAERDLGTVKSELC